MNRLFFLFLALGTLSLHATETILTVRVRARDAKFIGSSMGGAQVLIRDGVTGKLLAEGITEGSTGNTGLLMTTPIARGTFLSDDQTAKFEARLDIDEPTWLTIEVIAPAGHRQSAVRASTQLWLIPGRHITGDGLVLEIPGFVVDLHEPRTHQALSLASQPGKGFPIRTHVVMMCGCPVEEGGLWDSGQMEVTALVRKDGNAAGEVRLGWTATNTFEGFWKPSGPGLYELSVFAYNPGTGNTGLDRVNVIVTD